MSDQKRLEEIEGQIEDLQNSLPAHSIPTAMLLRLEELVEERDRLLSNSGGEPDAPA